MERNILMLLILISITDYAMESGMIHALQQLLA
jgi:hypothetical protein